MTERKLLTRNDFVTKPTIYTKFGEKVTRNPIEQIYNAGLLSEYKTLSTSHKYIKFIGMFEEGDGGEGIYIRDDNITDEEDIGVIIYIGQYKYRRLYGAFVLVDWFYIRDFGEALQRACKYASVRCVPGKVYDCNSEITLKLYATANNKDLHGSIDYSHTLIDLRGATINFNVAPEEIDGKKAWPKFCFNIRIYNRETKFMLTNGNFNVSELNKVALENIANIIGDNNYTDMLTDMHYNVEASKLPDTNRVVLESDPVMEGVKTFTKNLTYVGDNLSQGEEQAVTKEYMPEGIEEDKYIAIADERKIEGITRFNTIFDLGTGNVVTDTNVSDIILEALTPTLRDIMLKTDIGIYLPFMYYVKYKDYTETTEENEEIHYSAESPSVLFGGNWEEQLLLNGDDYEVYKKQQSAYVIIPQQRMIIDEEEINDNLFLYFRVNNPIYLDDGYEIAREEYEYTHEGIILYERAKAHDGGFSHICGKFEVTQEFKDILHSFVGVAEMADDIVYVPAIVKNGGTYPGSKVFLYLGVDGNYYMYRPYQVYLAGYLESASVNIVFDDATDEYSGDRSGFYFRGIRDMYTFNKPIYYNPAEYSRGRVEKNVLVTIKNNPLVFKSANIIGSEYVKLSDDIKIYTPSIQMEMDEEYNHRYFITDFYIRGIIPIQANLTPFNGPDETAPCARISFTFEYNKELIQSKPVDIYIPRYIATGVPEYEIPKDLRLKLPNSIPINHRYPVSMLYTNNTMWPRQYDIYPQVGILADWLCPADTSRHDDYKSDGGKLNPKCVHGSAGGDNRFYPITNYYLGRSYGTLTTKVLNKSITTYRCGDHVQFYEGQNNYAVLLYNFYSVEGRSKEKYAVGPYVGKYYFMNINDEQGPGLLDHKVFNTADRYSIYVKPGECVVNIDYFQVTHNLDKYTSLRRVLGEYKATCFRERCSCGDENWIVYTTAGMCVTPYLLSFNSGMAKPKTLRRLFGSGGFTEEIIRDGTLKDPFRERTLLPQHQFAAPVCAINP